jgi:hypothetical protein
VSDLVEVKTMYTKHSDGTVTERVTCCGQEWYSGPARVVFLDIPDKWPWERKNNEKRYFD